jgi:hypothetical protein
MKWKSVSYLIVVGITSIVLFSCYKSKNFSTNLTEQIDTAVVIQCYDQARVTAIVDEIFNDVNTVLGSQPAVTGASSSSTAPSGVTVSVGGAGVPDTITIPGLCAVQQILMDTSVSPYYFSINYSGYSCDNSRALSGNVTVYLTPGSSWQTAGDTIGVDITNLNIAGKPATADTNTLRFYGTLYYTNVSGGSLSSLTSTGAQPVVHEILTDLGNLGIVFNDDETDTANWQIARKRTYSFTNNQIQIQTTGFDSVGGVANVTEWGGNRFGNSFITSVSADTPLITLSGCNYLVSSGQIQITNPTGVTTMVYGLNASGSAATACPASGGFYNFSFSWTDPGQTPFSGIRPYPFW